MCEGGTARSRNEHRIRRSSLPPVGNRDGGKVRFNRRRGGAWRPIPRRGGSVAPNPAARGSWRPSPAARGSVAPKSRGAGSSRRAPGRERRPLSSPQRLTACLLVGGGPLGALRPDRPQDERAWPVTAASAHQAPPAAADTHRSAGGKQLDFVCELGPGRVCEPDPEQPIRTRSYRTRSYRTRSRRTRSYRTRSYRTRSYRTRSYRTRSYRTRSYQSPEASLSRTVPIRPCAGHDHFPRPGQVPFTHRGQHQPERPIRSCAGHDDSSCATRIPFGR